MSRRYNAYKHEGSKALPESAYNEAIIRINKMRDNVVAQFVNFDDFSVQDILEMLFKPRMLRIACEGHGVLKHNHGDPYYLLSTGFDVRITNMFADHQMLPIEEVHVASIMTPKVPALIAKLEQLRDIYQTWRTVGYVLTEMNKRCTVSALRAYWPTAAVLAPGHLPDEMPSTYREPLTIGNLTPLLRETASTVVMGMMAPDCEAIDARMVLKLRSHKFERYGIEISMEGDNYVSI